MAILQVDRLFKRFAGIVAVNNVDLSLEEGELLGLFGSNGAGKTTLFNLVAGAMYADSGRISFLDRDITRQPAFQRARLGIARTFQVVRPFRDLSVIENLLAAIPRERQSRRHDDKAHELLFKVGLDARAADRAGELTLGMLKRLEVARALALSPRLLLLDEPLAGLTAGESKELLALIRGLKAQLSIIMVEHNVRLALPVCDRAMVMDAGSVIAQGSPQEIRDNPDVVRAYLGRGVD